MRFNEGTIGAGVQELRAGVNLQVKGLTYRFNVTLIQEEQDGVCERNFYNSDHIYVAEPVSRGLRLLIVKNL